MDTDIELSVVIAIVSDTTNRELDLSILGECLSSLQEQIDPPLMEVIVPYIEGSADFSVIAKEYPAIRLLCFQGLKSYRSRKMGREHHDELRAQGILAATGRIVALIEDYARLDEHWSRNIITAHRQEFAGIGGAIENQIDRPLNWAVYFCDFGKYQNPLPEGKTTFASDANISYKLAALSEIRLDWQEVFHETQVNWSLLGKGFTLGLSPNIIIFQNRKNLSFISSLQERFIWGRSYAISRIKVMSFINRIKLIALSPLLPIVMFLRTTRIAMLKASNKKVIFICSPAIFLLILSWSFGELTGYLTNRI
jgi:hypothetical protein